MLERCLQINWIDQCPRAYLSSECTAQGWEPTLRTCSKENCHWLQTQMFPSVWISSDTGHPERLWNSHAGRLCSLHWKRLWATRPGDRRLETSRNPFQPKLCSDSRCKKDHGHGDFAPVVTLGDLKHYLEEGLSPGATATLKSSFSSLLTKAEHFLPLQAGDISILEARQQACP